MRRDTTTTARLAAFFDLDGTLIPEPSLEQRFFSALRRSGAIPLTNYLRCGVEALRLLPKGLLAVQQRNKRYLSGVQSLMALRHVASISFFEEGIARVAWHVGQGHDIVLVSGTLETLARMAAMALEGELQSRGFEVRVRICATRLEEQHGKWTGYVDGEALYGPAKASFIQQTAKKERIDLRQCHAYGNSLLDEQLLCSVGHAHAVNPGRDMAALANEKDWPIWHWYLEKKLDPSAYIHPATGIQHIERQA